MITAEMRFGGLLPKPHNQDHSRRFAPDRSASRRTDIAACDDALQRDYGACPSDVSVGAFCRPAKLAPYLSRRTPASAHQRMTLIS